MSIPAAAVVQRAGMDIGDLDVSRVSIRVMPPWMYRVVGGGVAAVTLSDTIFVAPDRYERVISGESPILLLHELVHVGQWRREGKVAFLVRYLSDYFRNRIIGLGHDTAYRAIGYEAAAYDASERPNRDTV